MDNTPRPFLTFVKRLCQNPGKVLLVGIALLVMSFVMAMTLKRFAPHCFVQIGPGISAAGPEPNLTGPSRGTGSPGGRSSIFARGAICCVSLSVLLLWVPTSIIIVALGLFLIYREMRE